VSGTAEGSLRTASLRLGLTVAEYTARIESGLLHCYRCRAWHPLGEFAVDRSRSSGRSGSCRASKRAHARRNYQPTARPSAGRRYVVARDDDRKQARRRVNHLVDMGVLPAPNSLPCADCGHTWAVGERRHEYDHYRGYRAANHEDVEAVCTTCHHAREDLRKAAA
jgi:hypothetical protein